jgi:DNA-binding CsgD family transcriptional regulator
MRLSAQFFQAMRLCGLAFMYHRSITSGELPQLTDKQREVLALVADNRTSKEIAGLLGVSESAVNQRIEVVRSRLGGLPRGELARLYRQEFIQPAGERDGDETWQNIQSANDSQNPGNSGTWQNIQLPHTAPMGQWGGAGGISAAAPWGSGKAGQQFGDGSQLSAPPTQRDGPVQSLVRATAMLVIILAGRAVAAVVTQMVGNS